jgi:asparagine synthase (glutamine-hydrolysing)
MCGIVGTVNKKIDEKSVQLLYHRGPDEQGLLERKFKDNKLYFGHTRLSIQDLSSAGSQPMSTDDGRYTIIFNGEIYNHYDLREYVKDVNYKGHSDTETILHYIAQNGIDAIDKLNGIFAFAFFDHEKGKLYLARDPFGVKPLYYKTTLNTFMYSSELKVITDLEKDELNYEGVYTLLALRFNPSPQTLFSNIKKLEPGHYIEYNVSTNKIVNQKFYSYKPQKNKGITKHEALKQYENLLFKAVERQMLSDVPIAVLLSGGVDSALVTKIAQEVSTERLNTYTAGYDIHSEANEFIEARESAKILGTNHHEVILSENTFFETLPNLVKSIEEPLGSQSIFPINFLSKKIHEDGYKVALTGQGVDEPWCGYGRYNTEIIFDNLQSSLWNIFLPLYTFLKHDKLKRGFRAMTTTNRLDRFVETYSVFNHNMINQITNNVFDGHEHEVLKNLLAYKFEYLDLKSYKGVDAMSFLDARMNLSDDLLLYTDKISMQHSLELRVPFLDIELMKFVESLPYYLKVTLFNNKILHKKLSERFLPKEIIYRKKKGFYTPRKEWFKGKLGERYLELLMNSQGSFAVIFNKKYIKSLFEEHKSGKVNYEKQLYLMIVMYYWLTYYVDGEEI